MYKIVNSYSSEYYQKLSNKVFVMAYSKQKSVCAIFDELTNESIISFLKDVGKTISHVEEYKIIGPNSQINHASRLLNTLNIKNLKLVIREGSFEVFYFSNENRLRVSLPDNSVSSVASTSIVNVRKENIKVLIVDDSKTIRNLLTKMISSESDITVCAEASKPSEVEELIKIHKPDVITLDIHMPEMTGVDLLKIIGPKYNIPTIMVTSISMEEGPLVLEALENGAFDYIQKPDMKEIAIVKPVLIEKIREAANSSSKSISQITKLGAKPIRGYNQDSLIVLGASTGGTNAIKDILVKFPDHIPPMLIVQHIPPVFSKAFADRMNTLCSFEVREARDGDFLKNNLVLVAPGGKQMKLINVGGNLKIEINDDAPVNRFKPSVDYMFNSVLETCKKKHVVAILLTGMGKDGAQGMLNLRKAGALTIAQDEESSVVYGMPKEAKEIGAAIAVEHKDDIAFKIGEFSWQTKAAS